MTRLFYDCTTAQGTKKMVSTYAQALEIKENGGTFERKYLTVEDYMVYICSRADGVKFDTLSFKEALKVKAGGGSYVTEKRTRLV